VSETNQHEARFNGISRLYGREAAEQLRRSHVCVIGIGGVGSWAAEALARCGMGKLTLVDLDEICASNINRQLPALSSTLGRSKAAVMRERILEINPHCAVDAREEFFTEHTADRILGLGFDMCLDAIDSVPNKALLIARCKAAGLPLVVAGAAGGKMDPTRIRAADLAEASHDKLLQRVRRILRSEHGFPAAGPFGIEAIFSNEAPQLAAGESCGPGRLNCDSGYGSATFVTGGFGFAAAALVARRIAEKPAK
jgi:tRNA A37 threonylcarbamoyladenosine dehydratase